MENNPTLGKGIITFITIILLLNILTFISNSFQFTYILGLSEKGILSYTNIFVSLSTIVYGIYILLSILNLSACLLILCRNYIGVKILIISVCINFFTCLFLYDILNLLFGIILPTILFALMSKRRYKFKN